MTNLDVEIFDVVPDPLLQGSYVMVPVRKSHHAPAPWQWRAALWAPSVTRWNAISRPDSAFTRDRSEPSRTTADHEQVRQWFGWKSFKETEVQRAYQRAQHFIGTSARRASKSEFDIFFKRFQEEPLFRGVVQDIDRIESQIEEAEEPRRRLSDLVGSFFSEGKSIRFTNSGIQAEVLGRQIPLAGLSSGEKQLVRILIEVIMTDDSVIIIDEPELSIHIDWQRELVKAMQTVNPAAQIVMATHAPEIMENVPDDCIFRL